MKAMIFAAGLGTRLRPLTDTMPKALVAADGKPMLGRVIEKLKDAGIDKIIVNVHYLANQIRDYLRDNDNFGISVEISDESDCLLETGGGILKARKWLDDGETFVVHNADILTDFDLRTMIDSHIREGNDVSLLVADRKSSRKLLFDSDMMLQGWKNEKTGEVKPFSADQSGLKGLGFGGVHIINPARFFPLLEQYTDAGPFSITPFYVDNCHRLDIRGYIPQESYGWFDIGSIEKLREAENYLREK